MFKGAYYFNQDISSWDVSNVKYMYEMFQGSTRFNQDISSWDVTNVEYMSYMFKGAYAFNQDLSKWNVGKCLDCMEFRKYATNYTLPIPNFTLCNPN